TNGEVVWDGNEIIFVGRDYPGPVDETIAAPGRVVTPGFINTHTHLADSPLDKSFVEDRGSRQFFLSGLFEYLPTRSAAADDAAAEAALKYSMAELLGSGTTTVMEIGSHPAATVAAANQVGMRLYMGDSYRSGRWLTSDGWTVTYEWDEAAGLAGLERAVSVIEEYSGGSNDRIRGFLSPAQVDT